MKVLFVESNLSGSGLAAMKVVKRLGGDVILAARSPAFYANNSFDLSIPDKIIAVTTSELREVTRVAKDLKVTGITSPLDRFLPIASRAAEACGLPHPSVDSIDVCLNKSRTRDLSKHIPVHPDYQVLSIASHESELRLRYPVIIKPEDDSSSFGVHLCRNGAEFCFALQDLSSTERDERDPRVINALLGEEFVGGDEFSVELSHIAGAWRALGVTAKHTLGECFVECAHTFPADAPNVGVLRDVSIELLHAIGLHFGAAHIEFKVFRGRTYLIEINGRLPGDHITDLVCECTGFDMIEHYVRCVMGMEEATCFDSPRANCAAIAFLCAPKDGMLQSIKLPETSLQEVSTVARALPTLPRRVVTPRSSRDRVGYIMFTGERDRVATAIRDVLCETRYEYEVS